jgi:hypothetical protein
MLFLLKLHDGTAGFVPASRAIVVQKHLIHVFPGDRLTGLKQRFTIEM